MTVSLFLCNLLVQTKPMKEDMKYTEVKTEFDREISVSNNGKVGCDVWLRVSSNYPDLRIASLLTQDQALEIGNALIESAGLQSLPFNLTLPETKVSENGVYVETPVHARQISKTTIGSIDEEIASLLALRGFVASNGELLNLYKVRDQVAEELFDRPYLNLLETSKKAIDRIVKAEGLAK